MKRAGWGRIVTISSGAGLRPSLTGIQAYAAARPASRPDPAAARGSSGRSASPSTTVAPGFVRSNPTTRAAMGSLWPGRAEAPGRCHPRETPRHARGHRRRNPVLRKRAGGAGSPGRCCPSMAAGREAPTSPRELADSHKAGAQFPSPLVGEDELGRRPSEEGGAGPRAPGRSPPAVHQPQGQTQIARAGRRGMKHLTDSRTQSPSCRTGRAWRIARPWAKWVLPTRGRRGNSASKCVNALAREWGEICARLKEVLDKTGTSS